MTLLQHIEALNARADLMMEQEQGLWMSKYTDDMSHWAEMGVYTVEDFTRYELINGISDASKDLYGCRMRLAWDEMDIEDLEQTYENICAQLRLQYEMEHIIDVAPVADDYESDFVKSQKEYGSWDTIYLDSVVRKGKSGDYYLKRGYIVGKSFDSPLAGKFCGWVDNLNTGKCVMKIEDTVKTPIEETA